MMTVYQIDVNNEILKENLGRICGQVFKLLPMFEEEKDWVKPLETVTIELLGMSNLFPDLPELLSLVCKLEGLKDSGEDTDFFLFRRTIFECCGLVNQVKNNVC